MPVQMNNLLMGGSSPPFNPQYGNAQPGAMQPGFMHASGPPPVDPHTMDGQFGGHMGPAGAFGTQMGDFRNALMGWRGQRPSHQGFDGTPQDWRTQLMDWRQQRPTWGGGQTMQPGGGTTGAPLPGLPQPTTAMPINPNAYQLPTY